MLDWRMGPGWAEADSGLSRYLYQQYPSIVLVLLVNKLHHNAWLRLVCSLSHLVLKDVCKVLFPMTVLCAVQLKGLLGVESR